MRAAEIGALRAGATALFAVAEAMHAEVRTDPRGTMDRLAARHDVVDSVIHQIGPEEFHRLLVALTDSACGYLRTNAEQATTLVQEQHAFAQAVVRELGGITDPEVVRRECAFCGRERSRNDDNHGPDCPYWTLFHRPGA